MCYRLKLSLYKPRQNYIIRAIEKDMNETVEIENEHF